MLAHGLWEFCPKAFPLAQRVELSKKRLTRPPILFEADLVSEISSSAFPRDPLRVSTTTYVPLIITGVPLRWPAGSTTRL